MSSIVLDASALLALLQNEQGSVRVKKALPKACISTVNLSEVAAKFVDAGVPDTKIAEVLALLDIEIIPLDEDTAILAGRLRRSTRSYGLSLGDRVCLALGKQKRATVLTTDKIWAEVANEGLLQGIRVEVLR